MKQEPQNSSSATENDSWEANVSQPPFTFDNPDYECWYPETEKYEAAETKYWRRQNYIGGIGVAISAFTFIAAIVAAVIAYKAYVANTKAVVEAKRQADAAIEANSQVQRPFVTFAGLQITQQNLLNPGLPYIWLTVLAQNSGNTPTKNMKYVVSTAMLQPLDPEDMYQKEFGAADGNLWRITLPPHYNGSLGFPASGIPASSFKTMVEQHQWYFVFGATHYEDHFTGSKEHVSKFCYAVGAAMNDNTQPAYEPCRFWNCADEDCEADQARYAAEMRKLNPQLPK
jgi:hypothetical protein